MRKYKAAAAAAAILALLAFGGCSMFSQDTASNERLVNGTTTGNIQNLGFAVMEGSDIYVYYTGEDKFDRADIIKWNPESGDSSRVMADGGLFMSIFDGSLYFCKDDGIYRAPMDTFEQERVLECGARELQIQDGQMFYIEDGTVKSVSTDGENVDFAPIKNAANLAVSADCLYYIDSASGQIWRAGLNGENAAMAFDVNAKQFVPMDGVFYYIDAGDGQIKSVESDSAPKTVVAYPCSGFNVNHYGFFYTREVDGKWVCCSADSKGENEKVIDDSVTSPRFMACMLKESSLIVGEEKFRAAAQ